MYGKSFENEVVTIDDLIKELEEFGREKRIHLHTNNSYDAYITSITIHSTSNTNVVGIKINR